MTVRLSRYSADSLGAVVEFFGLRYKERAPQVPTGPRLAYDRVRMRPRKCESGLCQNCVRYPLKPRANTVIYGDTPMHIVVAGSR